MDKSRMNPRRRRALTTLVTGLAAIPLLNLLVPRRLQAEELPHLAEDDPAAKALQYVHDASQANRTAKGGTAAQDQFCHNCRFIQADNGQWRPCQLFPGKAVNADGWCVSWTAKA